MSTQKQSHIHRPPCAGCGGSESLSRWAGATAPPQGRPVLCFLSGFPSTQLRPTLAAGPAWYSQSPRLQDRAQPTSSPGPRRMVLQGPAGLLSSVPALSGPSSERHPVGCSVVLSSLGRAFSCPFPVMAVIQMLWGSLEQDQRGLWGLFHLHLCPAGPCCYFCGVLHCTQRMCWKCRCGAR